VVQFSFSLNGKSLGVAFDSHSNLSLRALLHCVPSGEIGLYPAITLEQGESLIINMGQRSFKYDPLTSLASSSSSASSSISVTEKDQEGGITRSIYEVYQSNRDRLSPLSAPEDEENILLKELQILEERKLFNQCWLEYQSQATPVTTDAAVMEPLPSFPPILIEATEYVSAQDLERFGLDHLKHELVRRGLKAGGTLSERAQRLFAVRGISKKKIDKRLKAKK
jgi:hypothetical protein